MLTLKGNLKPFLMKKISLFLSALAMVAFVACSDAAGESDVDSGDETELVDSGAEDGDAEGEDAEAHVCTPECHEEGSDCPHMASSDGDDDAGDDGHDHDGHDHDDGEHDHA